MNPVILITWFGLLLVLPNQAYGYEDLENFDLESDKYLDQEDIIPQEKISDGDKISSSNKHYDLKEFPLSANFLTEEIDEGSDESDSPEFTSINDLIASQSIDTLAFTDNDFAISSNIPTSYRSGSSYNSNTPVSFSNDIPASHRSIDPTSSSSDFSFDIKPLSNSYTGPLSTQNAFNPIKSNSQSFSSNEISFNSNALSQRNPGLSFDFGAPSAGSTAPSASGYAPSPEINIQSFDSNIHQFGNNDSSFNSNVPQFSNNDPSFSSNVPQFSNNDPSFNSNILQFGNNDPSFSSNVPQISNNDPSFNSNILQFGNYDLSFNSNIPRISNNVPSFSSNIPPFPNNAPSFNPTINVNTPNFFNTPSLQSFNAPPLQSINPNPLITISSSFRNTAPSYNSNTPELNSNTPATFNGNDYTFKYGNGKFNRFNAIDITQLHKSIGKSYINIDQPSGRNAQYSEGSAQSLRSNDDHSIGNAQSFGNNKNLGTIDQFSGWSDQHFGAKDQSFGSNGQFFSNNIDFGAKDKFNEGHGQFSASNQDPTAPGKSKLYNFVIKEKSPSLEHIVSNNQFSHETVVEHANPQGYDAQSYDQPAPYAYEYAVEDSYHGTKFSAQENSDLSGNVVGSYSVLLPDGRTQYVNYNAAHGQGFVASVSYVDHSLGSGSSSNSISSGKSNLEHNKHLKTIPSLREGTEDHVSILPSFTQKTGTNFISLPGKSNPGRIKYKDFSV
ncbi:putative uncharacterized protein DDB_G0282499 [Eurytemora carolleeae]|uniref:putative uncharacterized protein DDB_G0282499 n=1 Tax=Eurytemora carolleeae TaxID=1294199 RepID=UPI000C77DEF1|nr:putative uncharacterized protein DDB_G0282499 [Eurytemora carolleeae]|eukprot:XP_023338093.1 putative uncharacterized protein DDB_G0282499 [Eurytemora affinis]